MSMQQELPDQPQEKHYPIQQQQQQQQQRHQQEKLTKIDLENLEQSVKKAASFGRGLSLSLVASVVIGVLPLSTMVNAEDVGTSQADLPNMLGRFIIENQTNNPVNFSVRWGNSDWKSYTQAPYSASTHSHALTGPNRAPQPYVRFGNKEYRVAWGTVGYTGFGSGGNVDNSVRHVFKYGADGHLDLFKQ